jgi:energy-coupling factor transporter ATP-binding protein EcfA2
MNQERHIGDTLLKVDNVSLSFGGVKALTDISLDVREHEVRAIIGPNGAGKSSMLNVINGVYHPQQGTITIPWQGPPRHEHVRRGVARNRPHVPEHRAVPRHVGARQHHDRPQPEDEGHALRAGDLDRPRAPRRARESAQGRGSDRLSGDPAHPKDAGRPAALTACKSASSSRALSLPSHRCCCSTSRWPE